MSATDDEKTDSAALAAAALAAVLAISGSEGDYDLTNVATGISILGVLYAYEAKRGRSRAKSLALGFVVGLTATLPLGYFAQESWRLSGGQFEKAESVHTAFAVWVLTSAVFYFVDQRATRKKKPNQAPEPTPMSVTPPAAQEPRQP